MRDITLPPLSLAAVLVAACAQTPATSVDGMQTASRQCFYSDQVRNFRSSSDNILYVRDTRNAVYQLDSTAGCWDIGSQYALTITPYLGSGSTRLCVGDDARIGLTSSGFGPRTCRARVTRTLSEEQVAALPSRDRP